MGRYNDGEVSGTELAVEGNARSQYTGIQIDIRRIRLGQKQSDRHYCALRPADVLRLSLALAQRVEELRTHGFLKEDTP
jgi:hypothetical protein